MANKKMIKKSLKYSVRARIESEHLITSNKEKCSEILGKEKRSEEDIIDFYISLHLVLEVSLNAFFRYLSTSRIKKRIPEFKVIKNLDAINLIDKTILFIYNSPFNFASELGEATKWHSIIGKMRNFSEVRNKLIHGHSISTIVTDGKIDPEHSEAREMLSESGLKVQIEDFQFIMEGMRFYFDHIYYEDIEFSDSYKSDLKEGYLDDSFLITQKNSKK